MTIAHRIRAVGALSAMAASVAFPMTSFASGAVFNGQAADYATLQVAKPGGTWQNSITGTAGDTLDLMIWDHNSVPETEATNVHIQVTMPSAVATTNHKISTTISADDAASVTGSVDIGSIDPTSISFVAGSAKIYKNSGGENPTMVETTWPTGVNPNNLITTGVDLGNQKGCWQYAKAIIFQVKLTGTVTPKGVLKITKDDRRTANDSFTKRTTVNPGERVEYRITAENIDEQGIARNIRLQDFLPAGVTYVAGSGKLTNPDGSVISIADGVTNGMVILAQLNPHEKAYFSFLADTATTFTDGTCALNKATLSGDNTSNGPQSDTADVCFVVKPKPTPTPTPTATPPVPTPKPTPQPTLPHTGPEGSLVASLMVSGFGLTSGRYALLKRKLKKQARNIDIA
jgi:uncharacterized repeat protein (TIGR01451 family)